MKFLFAVNLLFSSSLVFASSVDQQLKNVSKLARQANSRSVLNPKNGETEGYEIFEVQKSSLFDSMGLKTGDVISEIEGVPVSSPAQAMELFNQLKPANAKNIILETNEQELGED